MRDVRAAMALLLSLVALTWSATGTGATSGAGQRGVRPPGQDARPAATATSAVLGRVVDGNTGRPIAGAVVTVSGERVMTNRDGHFAFRNLPPGSLRIAAAKDGYHDGAYGAGRPRGQARPVELGADDVRTGLEIRLWRQSSISGVVVDEVGEPVPGIQVRAVQRGMAGGRPTYVAREAANTDDRGHYRLSDLVPGEYLVDVQPFIVSALQASIDAYEAMTPAERRDAGVQRPTSGGIRVGESQISTGWPALQPMAPPPGERLQVYRAVFHPSATSPAHANVLTVRPGDSLDGIDVQLQLSPTVTVSGRLTGPVPDITPDVRLSLIPAAAFARGADTGWDAEVTRAGPDGEFVFAAVPPGDYLIYAIHVPPPVRYSSTGSASPMTSAERQRVSIAERGQLLQWAESRVSVGTADITDLDVPLRPGLTVSGRFEFRGALPLPDDDVLARIGVGLHGLRDQPHNLPRAPVEDDPREFRTAAFPAGRYLVSVSSPPRGWSVASVMANGRNINLDPFALDENIEDVTVVFTDAPTAASITGSVDTSTAGSRDVWVAAVPATYEQWITDGLSQRRVGLETAADGTFDISGLPPGDYLVAAMAIDGDPALQDPDFVRRLSAIASRVTLVAGQSQAVALRAEVVR